MNNFQHEAAFAPRSPPHKHLCRLLDYNVKYRSERMEQGSGSKTAECASRRGRRQCGFVPIYSPWFEIDRLHAFEIIKYGGGGGHS